MFQFRAYASSKGYPLRDGLPHSDTHGSTLLCSSPWLFAALHVLHRLCMPRHPPCALNHFNYKACTRSSSPLKDQNPAHNPTVIRLIVASRIPHRIPNYLWRIYHAPSQARNIHFVFTLLLLHYVKELSSGATGSRTPDPLLAKQVL